MLRIVTNAPWYITNETLHHDLDLPLVKEEIMSKIKSYKDRITLLINLPKLNDRRTSKTKIED